jgi:hypothetical protein
LAAKPCDDICEKSSLFHLYSIPFPPLFSSKVHYAEPTVTRVIKDSSNIFDFSNGEYVGGRIIDYTYTDNGHISSFGQHIADNKVVKLKYWGKSSITFNIDNNGNIYDYNILYGQNDSWKIGYKFFINPYVNDSILFIPRHIGITEYYHFCCELMYMYLYISSFTQYTLDTSNNTWPITARDTVIINNSDSVVVLEQTFDSVNNVFKTKYIDNLFIKNSHIVKIISKDFSSDTIKAVCYGTYDNNGNETEETRIDSYWNDSLLSWEIIDKIKYIRTYNSYGDIIKSVKQDSTDHWIPIDSCNKWIYSYNYDNNNYVSTRTDSLWTRDDSIKENHFFTYQAFSSSVLPQQDAKNVSNESITISHNGTIKTTAPVSIDVYSISGKRIYETNMSASGSLWTSCERRGIAIGKGMYVAKIKGGISSYILFHE